MCATSEMASGAVALRPASLEDIPSLVDLTTAFYEEDGFTSVQEALSRRFRMFLGQAQANITVAATPEAMIGFALTTVRLILESGLVAELQDLYVRPEHRGDGIGSSLVRDAANWARISGAGTVEVVIAPNGQDVTHLHRYYESRGFIDEGRRLVYLDVSAED